MLQINGIEPGNFGNFGIKRREGPVVDWIEVNIIRLGIVE